LPEFPQADLLGRVTVGKVDVFARPDASNQIVGALYEDQVIPWIREVVGPMPGRINQRWVETPYGYVWGGNLQPVFNLPNINERFGSGDLFWGPAEAFRPLTADEIAPINPEAEEKRIVVNIDYQTLSCFVGKNEVYFARISSGALYDAWGNPTDAWGTPIGEFPIWRKAISLPLSGGSASAGWSLPAVGWVSLFVGTGVAIHSTYWHNNYGEPSSRGCVNASPEDAKWIFRWSMPVIPYDPGDVTVEMPGGTKVIVEKQEF